MWWPVIDESRGKRPRLLLTEWALPSVNRIHGTEHAQHRVYSTENLHDSECNLYYERTGPDLTTISILPYGGPDDVGASCLCGSSGVWRADAAARSPHSVNAKVNASWKKCKSLHCHDYPHKAMRILFGKSSYSLKKLVFLHSKVTCVIFIFLSRT